MNDDIRQLIFQTIDQTISPEDFDRLQNAIAADEEVRREYLRATQLCHSLSAIASETLVDRETPIAASESDRVVDRAMNPAVAPTVASAVEPRVTWRIGFSIAASMMLLVGGLAYWIGTRNGVVDSAVAERRPVEDARREERRIAGHATLRRSVDLKWPNGTERYREGDVLAKGTLEFEEGIAEIDFFCGATLIVEGPASLDVESDWSVHVRKGRMRANVPPAARGFRVKAADSEIIDLGTEFALEVGSDSARVEVIEGEVELRGGLHHGNLLQTGQGRWLTDTQKPTNSLDDLATVRDVEQRLQQAELGRFAEWFAGAEALSRDPRLIAYYPIAMGTPDRIVENTSPSGSQSDGTIIGSVQHRSGRFGERSSGLAFERPGSRVRARIEGSFDAFTFHCWVKIDGLDHMYNALFLADGYENGEPHWQIRDDGRLMFSVMVDDSIAPEYKNRFDKTIVKDAGRHRVYMTDPVWDISQAGRWFQLAAVYDPKNRIVKQYVNGAEVSSEEIVDEFYIDELRIGPAEIGNWGQPFRDSPWFAVRNLNGTIDELAIFREALGAEEIRALYDQGKPLGY